MPVSFQRFTKTGLMAAGLAASIGIAALAITRESWLKSASPPYASGPVSKQGRDKRPPVEVIQIKLTRRGFEPAEVNLQPGDIAFALSNRSNLRNPTFSLFREAGDKLKDIPFPNNKRLSGLIIKLTPGRYLLKVAQDPNHVCSITVSNK